MGSTNNEKAGDERKDEENGSSKEDVKPASIWADRIRKVEEKWDIELDESKNFAQRVDAIEKKALSCRSRLGDSDRSREEKVASDVLASLDTGKTLKEVE